MTAPRRAGPPDGATLVATAVAAVLGTVLALVVLGQFFTAPGWLAQVLLVLAAPAVAVVLVLFLPPERAAPPRRRVDVGPQREAPPPPDWLSPPALPSDRTRRLDGPPRPGVPAPPRDAERPRPPRDPVASGSVAVAVPGGAWWDGQAPPDATAVRPAAATRQHATAPPLSSYDVTRRVVQCPDCGGFRLGVVQHPPGFDFGCVDCDRRWSWQPGQAWPPTVADPGRRAARRTS